MVDIAVVAGILAAVFWGLSPVVTKRGYDHGGHPVFVTIIMISTGVVVFWGILAVTRGPLGVLPDITPTGYAVFLIGGVVGSSLGRLAAYTGIDRVGASIASATIGTNPVVATLLALVFLGEAVTVIQGVGILVVVTGITVLTLSKGGDIEGWRSVELLYPLGAALAFGAGGVIRRYGLVSTTAGPVEAAALNQIAALTVMGAYTLTLGREHVTRLPRRAYAYFVGAGLLTTLGLLMLFVGLRNGPVAIVTTLGGTQALFTTVFTAVLIRDLERVTPGVVLGALGVVAGVGLITLS